MTEEDHSKYSISTELKCKPLELIDIPKIVDESKKKWQNYPLVEVNDCVVRIGIIEGEFHWHKHDNEDEFFYVIDGLLLIDTEDETIELKQKQGFMVPRGVMHRTRAPNRTSILMVEGSSVEPTGD